MESVGIIIDVRVIPCLVQYCTAPCRACVAPSRHALIPRDITTCRHEVNVEFKIDSVTKESNKGSVHVDVGVSKTMFTPTPIQHHGWLAVEIPDPKSAVLVSTSLRGMLKNVYSCKSLGSLQLAIYRDRFKKLKGMTKKSFDKMVTKEFGAPTNQAAVRHVNSCAQCRRTNHCLPVSSLRVFPDASPTCRACDERATALQSS
jgi:hypothetical protein